MKNLNNYITEKLRLNKDTKLKVYNYHPKDRGELKSLVNKLIKERGNEADLNDIDTSYVTNMNGMFCWSKFNGDISSWDVSNVENMQWMFSSSDFNGNISNWDVSKVKDMNGIFYNSPLEKNPPAWYRK